MKKASPAQQNRSKRIHKGTWKHSLYRVKCRKTKAMVLGTAAKNSMEPQTCEKLFHTNGSSTFLYTAQRIKPVGETSPHHNWKATPEWALSTKNQRCILAVSAYVHIYSTWNCTGLQIWDCRERRITVKTSFHLHWSHMTFLGSTRMYCGFLKLSLNKPFSAMMKSCDGK